MATITQNREEHVIDALNELLRGEISAVETYDQALQRMDDDVALRADLVTCRSSHAQRVERLRSTITQLGGRPSEGSGAWGAFAKFLEGTAQALGAKAAITMLEEGEDHGLQEYRENLKKLDGDTRMLVASELLPAQQQTHDTVSAIKHSLT